MFGVSLKTLAVMFVVAVVAMFAVNRIPQLKAKVG